MTRALEGENTDYVRFIVLTSARSGSSFLTQSLRSHPQIVAFGEILGPGNVWFNVPGFPVRDRRLKRLRDREPVTFLDSFVFRGYPADTHAVGFKVFHEHLESPVFRPLVDHLRTMPRLRVIRLERGNLLRAYLSTVLRSKTGVGWIHSAAERGALSVSLDADACEAFFDEQRELRARYAQAFADRETLEVQYEDLKADFEGQTRSIQRFLDVPRRELGSETVVQEVRPLTEAITNYGELRDRFRATRWEAFFD